MIYGCKNTKFHGFKYTKSHIERALKEHSKYSFSLVESFFPQSSFLLSLHSFVSFFLNLWFLVAFYQFGNIACNMHTKAICVCVCCKYIKIVRLFPFEEIFRAQEKGKIMKKKKKQIATDQWWKQELIRRRRKHRGEGPKTLLQQLLKSCINSQQHPSE